MQFSLYQFLVCVVFVLCSRVFVAAVIVSICESYLWCSGTRHLVQRRAACGSAAGGARAAGITGAKGMGG